MKIFLLVVAGMVAGVILLAAMMLALIRWKVGSLTKFFHDLAGASGVSPFRIHLEAEREADWRERRRIDRATQHFETLGYAQVGDFSVVELPNVLLRAFWHPAVGCFGVLYDYVEVGVAADIVCDFEDGTHLTVSCAPETGMERPSHAPLVRLDVDLSSEEGLRTLHDRLQQESVGRERLRTGPEDFVQVFTEAYAQEMDWHIARGGVTRQEIERIAELSDLPAPDDEKVEAIQTLWSSAISDFIDEAATEAWLADSQISAIEWERLRDRLTVAHDHMNVSDRIDELAWHASSVHAVTQDEAGFNAAHDEALEQMRVAFEGRSPRDGFRAAQALLPEQTRFERVGSVEDPWPADIYAAPAGPDGNAL